MTTSDAVTSRGLSVTEALALPVMFDVWPTLGTACLIGRTATYELARKDALPIPCLRVGKQLRARRSDLLKFLGIEENGDEAGAATPTSPAERITEPTR